MNLLPVTLRQCHEDLLLKRPQAVSLGDELRIEGVKPEDFYGREFVTMLARRKQYSFTIEGLYANALVEFDARPEIKPCGTLSGSISITPIPLAEQRHYHLRALAPAGWQVECAHNLFTAAPQSSHLQYASTTFTVHAPEEVEAMNRIIFEITTPGRASAMFIPVQIMG